MTKNWNLGKYGTNYYYLPNALAALDENLQNHFVCEWVSQSHKRYERYRSQLSTDLYQTCYQGRVPVDMFISGIYMHAKPEVKLIFTIVPMEKIASMSNISKMVRYAMMYSEEVGFLSTMGFRLALWTLTQDDFEHSQICNLFRSLQVSTSDLRHWAEIHAPQNVFLVFENKLMTNR